MPRRIMHIMFGTFLLLVLFGWIPAVIHAADFGIADIDAAIDLGRTNIIDIVLGIIRTILGLLGIIVVGLILYAGFMWMTANGEAEKIATAKKILLNAVIGLAIIMSAFAITSFIIRSLSQATGSGCVGDHCETDLIPEPVNPCITDPTGSLCQSYCIQNPTNTICLSREFLVLSMSPSTDGENNAIATGMHNAVVRAVFSRPVHADHINTALQIRRSDGGTLPPLTFTAQRGNRVIEVAPAASAQVNLVQNSGFEDQLQGWDVILPTGAPGSGGSAGSITIPHNSGGGISSYEGSRYARLSISQYAVTTSSIGQVIQTDPEQTYVLSFVGREQYIDRPTSLHVRVSSVETEAVLKEEVIIPSTQNNWQSYTTSFVTGVGDTAVRIEFIVPVIGLGQAARAVLLDDIQVYSADTSWTPGLYTITVNPNIKDIYDKDIKDTLGGVSYPTDTQFYINRVYTDNTDPVITSFTINDSELSPTVYTRKPFNITVVADDRNTVDFGGIAWATLQVYRKGSTTPIANFTSQDGPRVRRSGAHGSSVPFTFEYREGSLPNYGRGTYIAHVTVYDIDGNSTSQTREFELFPLECEDPNLSPQDYARFNCGTPPGGACTETADCGPFMMCHNEVCAGKPTITSFDPTNAAGGNWVTVLGRFFGDTPGTIEFGVPSTTAEGLPVLDDENEIIFDWHRASPPSHPMCLGASWHPTWAIVEVPESLSNQDDILIQLTVSTTESLPLSLTRTRSTDYPATPSSTFTKNDIDRPGLCAFMDDVDTGREITWGAPRTQVDVLGRGFTNTSILHWGAQRGQISNRNLTVPSQSLRTEVPAGLANGRVGVWVSNGDTQSNGLPFTVDTNPEATNPVISYIDPTETTRRSYITIFGSGFGNVSGRVFLSDTAERAVACAASNGAPTGGIVCYELNTTSFPAACGATWRSGEVIVEVYDRNTDIPSGTYALVLQTNDAKRTSGVETITIIDGLPSPGICKIDPQEGPAPLADGAELVIHGNNFTDSVMHNLIQNGGFEIQGASSDWLLRFGNGTGSRVRFMPKYTANTNNSQFPSLLSGNYSMQFVYDSTSEETEHGYIEQVVRDLTPGRQYELTFFARRRYVHNNGPLTLVATVYKNNDPEDIVAGLENKKSQNDPRDRSDFLPYTLSFTPDTTEVVIRIGYTPSEDTCGGGSNRCDRIALYVDDVSLVDLTPTGVVRFWDMGTSLTDPGTNLSNGWLTADEGTFDTRNDVKEIQSYSATKIGTIFPMVDGRTIPQGSVPVRVQIGSGSAMRASNAVTYTVNACTPETAPTGYRCCTAGPEAGQLKPNGYVCEGETRTASYTWRMMSGERPRVLQVVEQCNPVNTTENVQPPSPSPWTRWGDSGTAACVNAAVMVHFSEAINELAAGDATLWKCETEGRECTQVATSTQLVGDNKTIQVYPSGEYTGNLQEDAWYQVRLSATIASTASATVNGREVESTVTLQSTSPCGAGTAYCFNFKTSETGRRCTLAGAYILPNTYTVQDLGPIYAAPGRWLPFQVFGVADQACTSLPVRGLGWEWDIRNISNTVLVSDTDSTTTTIELRAKDGESIPHANNTTYDDIRTVLTLLEIPESPLTLRATTTTQEQAVFGDNTDDPEEVPVIGTSTISFALAAPRVTTYWPNCAAACLNATLGVRFNRNMYQQDFIDVNVELLSCGTSRDCTEGTTPVNIEIIPSSKEARGFTFQPSGDNRLDPNTWYQVNISGIRAIGGYNRVGDELQPLPGEEVSPYSWGFRTKANLDGCFVESVQLTPSRYIARRIGERNIFTATPFGTPDECSPYGQQLNPFDYDWAWTISPDINVVTITQNAIAPVGAPGCTEYCTPAGSTRPVSDNPASGFLCGNGVVDPGETCDIAMDGEVAGLTCSYTCQRLGNSNSGEGAGQCGNGVIDVGEAREVVISKDSDYEIDGTRYLTQHLQECLVSHSRYTATSTDGHRYITERLGESYVHLEFKDASSCETLEVSRNSRNDVPVDSSTAYILSLRTFIHTNVGDRLFNKELTIKIQEKNSIGGSTINEQVMVANLGDTIASLIDHEFSFTTGNNTSHIGFSLHFTNDLTERAALSIDGFALEKVIPGDRTTGEQCDLGPLNGVEGSGCSATCTLTGSASTFTGDLDAPHCSIRDRVFDGVLDPGEECEINGLGELVYRNHLGNTVTSSVPNPRAYCTDSCLFTGTTLSQAWCDLQGENRGADIPECRRAASMCGNGILESGEVCEILPDLVNGQAQIIISTNDPGDRYATTTMLVTPDQANRICNQSCLLGNICPFADIFAENDVSTLWCDPDTDEGCTNSCTLAGSSILYGTLSQCRDNIVGIGEYAMCEVAAGDDVFTSPSQIATALGQSSAVTNGRQESAIHVTTTRYLDADREIQTIPGSDQIGETAPYYVQCGFEEYAIPMVTGNPGSESLQYNDAPTITSGENEMNSFTHGVATNSCLYERETVDNTYPQQYSINVCRNTLMEVEFEGTIIESASLHGNVMLAQYTTSADGCIGMGMEDVTTQVRGTLGTNAPVAITMNFFERIWHGITSFFARLIDTVFAYSADETKFDLALKTDTGVWCNTGMALGTNVVYAATTDTSGNSRVQVTISNLLEAGTMYTLLLRSGADGVVDHRGVPIRPSSNRTIYYGVPFETGEMVCKVDSITVSPSGYVFTAPFATTTFSIENTTAMGERVVPIPNVYDWEYSWAPSTSQLFRIPVEGTPANNSTVIIGARDIEGSQTAQGRIRITRDTETGLGNQEGRFFTDTTELLSRFCANYWGESFGGTEIQTGPYQNEEYNFSFDYCADAGLSHTTSDDLPLLSTPLSAEPPTPDIISRQFFFNESAHNPDVIGIQVFLNPNRLDPRAWYASTFGTVPSSFQSVTVHDYPAITDGTTYYIHALNVVYNSNGSNIEQIHSNIYQFTVNEGAQAETQEVFRQIMQNLRFNTNVSDHGYCLIPDETSRRTITDTEMYEDTLSCRTDFNCLDISGAEISITTQDDDGTPVETPITSGICSNNRTALLRDMERIRGINIIQSTLESSRAQSGINQYPTLASGTFYPGYSVSRWPSWGRFVGGIPMDPINQWTQCGAPGTDQQTCWEPSEAQYHCPAVSSVYEYVVGESRDDYSLHAQFEFLREDDPIVIGLVSDIDKLETAPWCNPETAPTRSPSAALCGDGIVQPGEQCDPPRRQVSQSHPDGFKVQICSDTCQLPLDWDDVSVQSFAVCGNGIIEPNEQCDAGVRNGLYGSGCSATCTITNALSCGNGTLDYDSETGTYHEFCDEEGGVCMYRFDGAQKIEPMLYFLVDVSGSMNNSYTPEGGTSTTRWNIITSNEGLPRVFTELQDKTLLALGTFANVSNHTTVVDMGYADSEHVSELIKELRDASVGGATYLGAAIKNLILDTDVFNPSDPIDAQRPKSLILVVDGDADDEVVEHITTLREEMGIYTYVIGVGATQNNFNSWATAGGSREFYRVDTAEQIVATIRNLTRCYSYALRPGNTCNASCTGFGSYCGDGVVNTANGEQCDLGDRNGVAGSGCDSYCRIPTASTPTPTVPTGTCGDGIVQNQPPNVNGVREVCDLGSANGIVPAAAYGERRTYCSADCTAVLTVDADGYCGDGIVQPEEVCDVLDGVVQDEDGDVLCVDRQIGAIACTNSCQTIVNNCVDCVLYESNEDLNGKVLPSFDLRFLNATGDYMSSNFMRDGSASSSVDSSLRWSLFTFGDVQIPPQALIPHSRAEYISAEKNLGDYVYNEWEELYPKIESNAQCMYTIGFSKGAFADSIYPNSNGFSLATPNNRGITFPFPVYNELQTIRRTFVISPPVPENSIRIVVRWENYGSGVPTFKGGMYYVTNSGSPPNAHTVTLGSIDPNQICNSANCNNQYNNIFQYHAQVYDRKSPTTGSGAQSITVNLNTLNNNNNIFSRDNSRKVAYFVQHTAGVIAPYQRDGKVFVDVYVHRNNQDDTQVYVPQYTFALDSAQLSSNDIASTWHVFNLIREGGTIKLELLDANPNRTKLELSSTAATTGTTIPTTHGQVRTRFCEVQEDARGLARGVLCNPSQ